MELGRIQPGRGIIKGCDVEREHADTRSHVDTVPLRLLKKVWLMRAKRQLQWSLNNDCNLFHHEVLSSQTGAFNQPRIPAEVNLPLEPLRLSSVDSFKSICIQSICIQSIYIQSICINGLFTASSLRIIMLRGNVSLLLSTDANLLNQRVVNNARYSGVPGARPLDRAYWSPPPPLE